MNYPDTQLSFTGSQIGMLAGQSDDCTHGTHSSPTGSHRGVAPLHCVSFKHPTQRPSFVSHSVSLSEKVHSMEDVHL
jgi:hypothetical protein